MRPKLLPAAVLVAALAAFAATVGYAVAHATNGGGHMRSMMRGNGYAMMGANGMRTAWYLNGSGPVDSIAAARAQAQKFADRLGLRTAEVIRFTDNYYVRLDDEHGRAATEVLVDPQTGAVTLEYGPAMMWNTRYSMVGRATTGAGSMMGGGMMGGSGAGMMGGSTRGSMMRGMMGRVGGTPSWTPGDVSAPVGGAEARTLANRWLARQGTGEQAAAADALPGYYTMETLKDGKIAGMISVDKATGAVWYHWWHGRFVAAE